ncbi:tubulin-like doman-containing protein [Deinococcus sp. 6YEL10]|uniref:tubulin-like doman-containing protein n=1 Tax=Deinococcus sp. 6YEL10 TaxID=2745870 RepID=UPI001E573295|nr:tubulin-like doman-containing protein [Deinococcus sp. 6YEL10]MCD0161435.1 tubulin-like doman-containing protein [Deinococcus sp. 6YEL10]
MADNMRVFKTLVIGLGSTGTEILEALADRIDWEVGGLGRAPWVEFLAVETDVAKPNRFNGTDDFKTLGVPATSWRDMLERPELYDSSIALRTWADLETLKQLPAQSIDSGAGHIRMVGRLALLYPPNYNEMKNAISQRVARLRSLTEAQAKSALNANNAGLESNVQFAVNAASGQTGVRVIVVGTLCGGTCSGTASDMGILLRTILDDEEKTLGMFTLPHPDLGIAQKPDAEIWKTNAYHALAELNQYHLHTDTERYRSIKFPDKPEGTQVVPNDAMPYDLVYLLRPSSTEGSDLARLSNAIADRMFLNVFVPETDPMAYMVNAGPVTVQQGRAFAFSTFGLSTIEYPMRRILEALKYRTLVHAVDRWKDRKYEGNVSDDLDALGLTIPALTETLLLDGSGASIRASLDAKKNEIMRAVRTGKPEAARRALDELRLAFGKDRGDGLRGLVHETVNDNRRRAADSIMGNVRGMVGSRLLDYDSGPNVLLEIMQAAQPRLGELRGWEPGEGKTGAANGVLDQLDAIRTNTLLGMFFLKGKASKQLLPALSRALDDELKSRVNQKVREALQDRGSGQRAEAGTLTLIDEETQKIARRLMSLRKRLTNQADRWREARAKLENDTPNVNGLSLFEPSPHGTVDKEEELATDERGKETHASRLIQSWQALTRGVMPGVNDPDWLLGPWAIGQDNFERAQLNALEQMALEPFEASLRSGGKDVVKRLYDQRSPSFDPNSQAMHAATQAQLFLQLNQPLGQVDPMSPLPRRKLLVGMNMTDEFRRSVQPWVNKAPAAKEVTGVDPYRVVMLEEWYRFALRGADDVRTLSFSQPKRFSNYFTRKRSDIDWTPINDREIKQLEDAEQLVFLSALHGVTRLEAGHLVMDWPMQPGEADEPERRVRRLPGKFGKAARKLAFESKDSSRPPLSLTNASSLMHSEITARMKHIVGTADSQAEGRKAYVKWLHQQLKQGQARAVDDWNDATARAALMRHLTADDGLRQALLETFPPDNNMINGLYMNKGEALPRGLSAPDDGFYCQVCGGPVGATREEVIQNGLLCSYHPEGENHPFGRPYSPLGV